MSNVPGFVTLTGMSHEDVLEELQRVLPPNGYKAIPGSSANLTDIKPPFLVEALTKCFGLCGLGWGFNYALNDLSVAESPNERYMKFAAYVKGLVLWYVAIDGDGKRQVCEITAPGGSKNSTIEYAMKGAITNALGTAASWLTWQIDVYKGELSHENAREVYESGLPEDEKIIPPDKVKVLYNFAKAAGVDLSDVGVRNSILAEFGIPPAPVADLKYGHAKIVAAFLKAISGKTGEELQAAKSVAREVAILAVANNVDWEAATDLYASSVSKEVSV